MNFDPGEIVEVPFPFVDLPVRKRRPALVLGNDERSGATAVLAMITSAKRSRWESDVSLQDWSEAGLNAPSLVRWKIFTLETALIADRRGTLSEADRVAVGRAFKRLFRHMC